MGCQIISGAWVAVLVAWVCSALAAPVQITPSEPAPGEIFRVRLETEDDLSCPCRFRMDGKQFPLWPDRAGTWEGFGAVDRDTRPGSRPLEVLDREGRARLRIQVRVRPRVYGTQEIRVDPRLVRPRGKDAERARREARLIRSVLSTVTPLRFWSRGFRLPARGAVSGPFGVKRVYNGTPRGYHSGLDIAAPKGTPVRASAAGRVALARELYYTGNTVFLDHGLGLYTAYFHMDSLAVREGERVEAGAVLGSVGSTGRSTGPHLHWGVYVVGVKADPLSLLEVAGLEGERPAVLESPRK